MTSFAEMGVLPTLRATMSLLHITTPTEIQERVIPELLAGNSVVGVAETGSGKTLAYALPVLHKLKTLENEGSAVENGSEPRAIVLVPSRELGEQVARVFKSFTHDTRLRVRVALGGVKMVVSRENTKGPFEVLVATPGRLTQLVERKGISLADVRMIVLDEADQLLDLGFMPDVLGVVNGSRESRQLALFSATMPPAVTELVERIFRRPVMVKSRGSHRVVASLTTLNRKVIEGRRFQLLQEVLREPSKGGTLIFTNTREQCDKLVVQLREVGRAVGVFRGEMDRNERRNNLKAFREGTVPILVSTDLGSRGLDVEHVTRVINYNLPKEMENYLHRVGRTARAGRSGSVINFVTDRDTALVAQLEGVKAPRRT